MSSNLADIPKPEEIEISLFGPGFGECIVMHIGSGRWIIIDSCIDPKTKRPAALRYLNSIDIDPSTSVKAIIASHWHDDHVRGLSEIVEACPSTPLVCSTALHDDNFMTLLELYNSSGINDSGLREFEKTMRYLENRPGKIIYATSDKTVLKQELNPKKEFVSCEVRCLSPLDEAVTIARKRFANHYCNPPSPAMRRMPSLEENDCSIVLKVIGKEYSFLLGSDLENNGQLGWDAVVSKNSMDQKSMLLKIPHHGSATGHLDAIWRDLLTEDNPYALITPFMRGKTRLPDNKDVERIKRFTNEAYITADLVKTPKKYKHSNIEEKFLTEATKQRQGIHLSSGHIRFRVDITTGKVSVDLFNEAKKL
jgi:beta-lactamase superfamily II metal-dependent hydrolase